MGEIKSTLDLVMEKTRHLTLSDEERRSQALSEYRKSLNGMIQQYVEKTLTLDRFKKEWRSPAPEIQSGRTLLELVEERVDLNRENTGLLKLIEEACGLDAGPIASAIDQYRETLQTQSNAKSNLLKSALHEEMGIHGSAVWANLDGDAGWVQEKEALWKRFEDELKREFERIRSMLESRGLGKD